MLIFSSHSSSHRGGFYVNFDLVIKNGKIIDGTGNPWYQADIGIENGKISKIGRFREGWTAETDIDAEGRIITPGFIDLHTHNDIPFHFDNRLPSMLAMGITTSMGGNCGISLAPVNRQTEDLLQKYVGFLVPPDHKMNFIWESFAEYLDVVEKEKSTINLGFLVGHGALRIAAMGFDNRDPTPNELETMQTHVKEAMQAGAFGFSSGLIYPPGSYCKTSELIALAKVAAEYGGVYFTHIRNESDQVIESVKEAIQVGEGSGGSVHIAHLKAAGQQNWGKSKETLKLLEDANAKGIHVTADQYPYIAGSTYLSSIYPQWAHEGGIEDLLDRLKDPKALERLQKEMESGPGWVKDCTWDGIVIGAVKTDKNRDIEGKSVAEIAKLRGTIPFSAANDLMIDEGGEIQMIIFAMDDADVQRIMKHPLICVGSDGWACSPEGVLSGGKPHPRSYGTFPRVLGKYVRQDRVLTLQDAIRKMTSFSALQIGLFDRGLLREGYLADVVIFDSKTIQDRATFDQPHQYPKGICYVIVNGEVTLKNNVHTGAFPGRVLRHRN